MIMMKLKKKTFEQFTMPLKELFLHEGLERVLKAKLMNMLQHYPVKQE